MGRKGYNKIMLQTARVRGLILLLFKIQLGLILLKMKFW